MNRKFEDKLVQLAFGDMSAEEAARVEAEAKTDPIAAQTLASYRDMRSGFSLMSDVPEDQLSKERLRDAILAQGLKPKPVPRFALWSYAWMPVAACAFTFGILMVRQHGKTSEPMVVMGPSATAKAFGNTDVTKLPNLVAMNPPTAKSVDEKLRSTGEDLVDDWGINDSAAQPAVDRSYHGRGGSGTGRSGGRHKRHEPEPQLMANIVLAGGVTVPLAVSDSAPPASAQNSMNNSQAALKKATAKPSGDGPIILIDQQQDAETGAQRATEVGSASNVIVGG